MRFSSNSLKAQGFSVMPQAREHRVSLGLMLLEFYCVISTVISNLDFSYHRQTAMMALTTGSLMAMFWVLRGFRERPRYYLDDLAKKTTGYLAVMFLSGLILQLLIMFYRHVSRAGLLIYGTGAMLVVIVAIMMMLPLGRRISPAFLPDTDPTQ